MPTTNPKPKSAHATNAEITLTKELKELTKEIGKLKSMELIQVFKHPWKFMGFSFLKGLMVGFGSVLGASVLVGFFIFLLGQISFVPYLGDFVEDIISQVQINKQISPRPSNESDIQPGTDFQLTPEKLENNKNSE